MKKFSKDYCTIISMKFKHFVIVFKDNLFFNRIIYIF